MKREYLGDGVYVRLDGGLGIVLETDNGIEVTNRIYLEWSVLQALEKFVDELKSKAPKQ